MGLGGGRAFGKRGGGRSFGAQDEFPIAKRPGGRGFSSGITSLFKRPGSPTSLLFRIPRPSTFCHRQNLGLHEGLRQDVLYFSITLPTTVSLCGVARGICDGVGHWWCRGSAAGAGVLQPVAQARRRALLQPRRPRYPLTLLLQPRPHQQTPWLLGSPVPLRAPLSLHPDSPPPIPVQADQWISVSLSFSLLSWLYTLAGCACFSRLSHIPHSRAFWQSQCAGHVNRQGIVSTGGN